MGHLPGARKSELVAGRDASDSRGMKSAVQVMSWNELASDLCRCYLSPILPVLPFSEKVEPSFCRVTGYPDVNRKLPQCRVFGNYNLQLSSNILLNLM